MKDVFRILACHRELMGASNTDVCDIVWRASAKPLQGLSLDIWIRTTESRPGSQTRQVISPEPLDIDDLTELPVVRRICPISRINHFISSSFYAFWTVSDACANALDLVNFEALRHLVPASLFLAFSMPVFFQIRAA
jgi:hypothetical protein